VALRYGFREYDGPPLEPLEMFTTKSGDEIVGQLYNFQDKGDREVALRPEMTPTLARMAAAHERNYKKPIKWFAIPQLFRYERQQKGRLREHFQFNADILGETDPAADAELIALLIDSLRALGLTREDFVIRLSSRQAWHQFFTSHHGDPAGEYAFYQVVDKLERESPEHTEARLQPLGFSLAQLNEFIAAATPTADLQRILDELQWRGLHDFVKVDYRVIRGLAYYTGTVFEAFDGKGEFRAIAGGGRYDHLVKLLSGGKVDLPAMGFGMGDVVLTELLKARGLLPTSPSVVTAYALIEDEGLRSATVTLVQQLREADIPCEFPLTALKADKQFKRAQELGARVVLRIEPGGSTVKVRSLADRSEIGVPLNEVAAHLRR
jgi:histidyl-tRNA synthetase